MVTAITPIPPATSGTNLTASTGSRLAISIRIDVATAPVALIGIGMTVIIITGGIDVSVGSIVMVCSVVVAQQLASSDLSLLLDVKNWVILEDKVGGRLGCVLGLGLVGLLFSLLGGVLEVERLSLELLSIVDGVANVDVVEENVLLHGPDLETNLWHVSRGSVKLG